MNSFSHKTEDLMKEVPWYHGDITRHAAEVLLLHNGEEGSFLLRGSASEENDYCVSVRGRSDVKHFKLVYDGAIYHFGLAEFDSVSTLVSYFANQPMIGLRRTTMGQNFDFGTLLTLKHPYPFDVPEPEGFDDIRMQSTISVNADTSSLYKRLRATPIASRAGYLTKQGGSVKSWKRRWFSCVGDKLSYFEDRDSEKPIFTIDLQEARKCYRSEIPGRPNCFTLECKGRTWLFSADSDEEAFEWTKLLNWKLANGPQ